MATNFTKAERSMLVKVAAAYATCTTAVTPQGKAAAAVARVRGCVFEQFVCSGGVEFSHCGNYYQLVDGQFERIA